MSLPEIQYQLTGRPRLLAGSTWFFLNGRPISYALAGAIGARALSSQADPVAKQRISLNPEVSMSASRDASLGHACVSPLASDADQKATGEFAGVGQSFSDLRKAPADGRSR